MSLAIRLVPHGRKKRTTYRIRSGERRRKLTGVYREELGWYDPAASGGQGVVGLRRQAYIASLNNGAQASPTLESLIRRALNGSGPILQLIEEETRDSAGGSLVELPITSRRGATPIHAFLRVPDPLSGDRTAAVDRLIGKTPVAQFVVRSGPSEVMTVFVEVQGQKSELARASFRWKTGVTPTIMWTRALAFIREAAAHGAAYVSFESDGELLEPMRIDWTQAEQQLDAAVMALRAVNRIHLFTADHEITIESTSRGNVLSVAVHSQSFLSETGRQAVLSLLYSTVASDRQLDEQSMAGALDAVSARVKPALRVREAIK